MQTASTSLHAFWDGQACVSNHTVNGHQQVVVTVTNTVGTTMCNIAWYTLSYRAAQVAHKLHLSLPKQHTYLQIKKCQHACIVAYAKTTSDASARWGMQKAILTLNSSKTSNVHNT